MSYLAISLLGSFLVALDNQPLIDFATDKVRALLAYLAVESDRPQRREALATLLWPDSPESKARNNLRQTIFQLRRTLRESSALHPCLFVTASDIQLKPGPNQFVDVGDFECRLATYRAHCERELPLCRGCVRLLEKAIDLYKGDFLAGFSLPGCPQFAWWQLATQERLHRQALEALSRLVGYFEERREYSKIIQYAQKTIRLEPWRESAHRRLMRALALGGRPQQALQQYETCAELLDQELGVTPSILTTRLYEAIQAGAWQKLHDPEEINKRITTWQGY